MKYLTAFEIREKYKNDKVVSWAFKEQMRRIEEAAEQGETMALLLQTVYFFTNEKGETVIGTNENFKQQRKDVAGIVLDHFLKLGYKKTKIAQCPYISWAERLI